MFNNPIQTRANATFSNVRDAFNHKGRNIGTIRKVATIKTHGSDLTHDDYNATYIDHAGAEHTLHGVLLRTAEYWMNCKNEVDLGVTSAHSTGGGL